MVGRALGGSQCCGAAGGHHGRRPADVIDQPSGCVLRSPGFCLRHARPQAETMSGLPALASTRAGTSMS